MGRLAMPPEVRKRPASLVYVLGFVMVLFIGILIFVYAVTKRTNPVVLDEQGKPVVSGHDHAGH
jgi:hypothetical protein